MAVLCCLVAAARSLRHRRGGRALTRSRAARSLSDATQQTDLSLSDIFARPLHSHAHATSPGRSRLDVSRPTERGRTPQSVAGGIERPCTHRGPLTLPGCRWAARSPGCRESPAPDPPDPEQGIHMWEQALWGFSAGAPLVAAGSALLRARLARRRAALSRARALTCPPDRRRPPRPMSRWCTTAARCVARRGGCLSRARDGARAGTTGIAGNPPPPLQASQPLARPRPSGCVVEPPAQ